MAHHAFGLSVPRRHLTGSTPSSNLTLLGSYLTATSTGLFWNFAGGVGAEFSIAPPNQTVTQYHLYTNRYDVDFDGVEYAKYWGGEQQIAAATAGVPEPTVWALMLVGFGGLGAALRARRASLSHA